MNELNWHPRTDDPAWMAGQEFMERNRASIPSEAFWAARQAFWCGVRWSREQRGIPVLGSVGEEGKVTWREQP